MEQHECNEVESMKVELLQHHKTRSSEANQPEPENSRSIGREAIGGDRHYLLVRPCARWAGDGVSGLPRHRVTSECCGDAVCSTERWEDFDTCPQDCMAQATSEEPSSTRTVALPPTQSTLFGELPGMEHDEYHCEGQYENETTEKGTMCSARNAYANAAHKLWLSDLLDRSKAGTLPFEMPPPGSVAVEFGCGLGQDSQNLAKLAGFEVTSIDVSYAGIEHAKNETPSKLLGTGPGKIEFIAYDALALPAPRKRVDYVFDATVYCSLRYARLDRIYEVMARIATPGHTLLNFQCWNWEEYPDHGIARARRDMEADFEPYFDILHSEQCKKNQGGGPGWCFYLKMKPADVRSQISDARLKLQHAARDGDTDYVRKIFEKRSGSIDVNELRTLDYIAKANVHQPLSAYLMSISPKQEDPFFETMYGVDALPGIINSDDRLDGSVSARARVENAMLKANWERAESQVMLESKIPDK